MKTITPLKINYIDDDILLAEKPGGLPCLPNMMNSIVELYPEQASSVPLSSDDMGLLHRLDNDTSGIILIARNDNTWEKMRNEFKEGRVYKEYWALVMGKTRESGTIQTKIAHHGRKRKKMIVCESETRAIELKGRAAHTEYRTLAHFKARDGNLSMTYSLLSVVIKTGVRHQIRAHLAAIGFPIAGDKLYLSLKRRFDDILKIDRHFLHAHTISFRHPTSGERLHFTSKLANDLNVPLKGMGKI